MSYQKPNPEYVDWVNGGPPHQTPIPPTYNKHRTAKIKSFPHTGNREKKTTNQKYGLTGTINCIQEKRHARIIEEEADRLQKQADQNDMHPIWDYQCHLRNIANARNVEIKKTEGTECQGMSETMKRWEERTAECFSKNQGNLDQKSNIYMRSR